MRHSLLVIALLVDVGLAVGCRSTNGTPAAEPKQSDATLTQSPQEFAYGQKADFVSKMKKELVEIQEELDRLSVKVDNSTGAAKTDAKAKLAAVREQWAAARKQLDQAEAATESTWDDVRSGFKKSYLDLKDSFTQTRQWLSDKIAP